MGTASLSADGRTIIVTMPMRLRRRPGRKTILAPDGGDGWAPRRRIDNTLVRALARAHRWTRLMESGKYASMTELAAAEKVDQSYLARMLRLTLLAPAIVEAILDGRQTSHIALADLLRPFPPAWAAQCEQFGVGTTVHAKSASS
jgi:hypothetical protein